MNNLDYDAYDYDNLDPIFDEVKPPYEHPGDAVFELMEQFYNSANSIDEAKIKMAFRYLCKQLEVYDLELLDEPLCVVHYKEKR